VIVCVSPNPAIDKLFTVERLEPGAIHRPTSFVRVPGGKGLNVARAAAALGAEVRAAAWLGGHHGRWIADELDALGIPLTAVWHSGETRSCLSVADGATQSLTEFYEDASPVTGDEWTEFVQRYLEAVEDASWVTVSGSLPPGSAADGYAELARHGNVAIDTTQLGAARPALLKVNAAEAFELTGLDAIPAAKELHQIIGGDGIAVVVTRGEEGAVLIDPDEREWHGRLDSWGPYPVGSGDAFLAGLVVARDRSATWPDALKAALGAGAANAEVPGAGLLDRARAELLSGQARTERIDR
jgi:1-phosphofructokinase family hexose kinase